MKNHFYSETRISMFYKIQSELSENQIESDVSSYLGYITPFWSKRFRLISVDEQATGADKLFNRFQPIYLQFKVSQGLDPKAFILPNFLNKPLPNIISYRKKNNLPGDPILYFELRKRAATANDFQHNILHSLHKPPSQYALYIAPLTLYLSEYEKLSNINWFRRFFIRDPFYLRELEINDSVINKDIKIGMNPFLRSHISIPPHLTVSTHNHHYSFSQSGGDVAWHGGELLADDFRLSTQWGRILNNAYLPDNNGINRDEFYRSIEEFFSLNINTENNQIPLNNNSFSTTVASFASVLKINYNIKLMFLQWYR